MPIFTGVLHALVLVDYLRFAISCDGLVENFYRIRRIQRVVHTPANYITAIDINDGIQIRESVLHRDVEDVGAQYLIASRYLQTTKQIWHTILGPTSLA